MTTRRPRARPPRRADTLEEFPALRDFLSGYLHEDFAQEHATPEDAVSAFWGDARPAEVERLRRETARFAQAIAGWPWRDVQQALRALGAAWAPRSRADLDALLNSLTSARPR